tara:strand:+ start:423 stop:1187 length:765 start_codon:yes stop_codon:yes gene_type:complete
MKKILAVICFSFLSLNFANAEITLGISGNAGLLSADGKETITGSSNAGFTWNASASQARAATENAATTQKTNDELAIGYVSLFGEADVFRLTGLRVGISYVPYALESETTANDRVDQCNAAEAGTITACVVTKQTVQVNLEDLVSMYLSYHRDVDNAFINSVFVKAGIIQADVITNEKLSSGSQYGNTELSGEFIGIGVEKDLKADGMFVRLEGNITKFDAIKLTNTNGGTNKNVIDINGLDGSTATISIGKTF